MRESRIQERRTARLWAAPLVVLLATLAAAQRLQIPFPNPINHVIIIDQENRTIDNLFGSNSPGNPFYLPGLDVAKSGNAWTLTNGKKTVFTVTSVALPLASTVGSKGSILADDYDPNHSHSLWVTACDAPHKTDPSNLCAMDGFNHVSVTCDFGATGCPGPKYPPYAYVRFKDVAPYFQIASTYGYANYMFQTNQGPSYPSHLFTFGGTSQPGLGPEPTWFIAENDLTATGKYGCAADPGTLVQLVNPSTQDEKTEIFPCINQSSLADVFAAATPQITWTYYTAGSRALQTSPNSYESLCTVVGGACTGPYWNKGQANGYVNLTPSNILTDISKCKLSQVNWVIPLGLESDHAGLTDGSGPSWVASIINAIGTQPTCSNGETYWNNTVILITWDDWGGWYDHVPPTGIHNSYEYGFRVPLIVVSPYAKAAHISHVTHDFGSVLKFIETTFGLPEVDPAVGYADSRADDLSDCFDLNQTPLKFTAVPSKFNAQYFLNDKRPPEGPDDD